MGASVHKLVQARLRGHKSDIGKIILAQLLARLVWIAPLFLPISLYVRLLWLVGCGLFAVLPLRFGAVCQMRSIMGDSAIQPAPYFSRVLGGGLRCLLGGLWGMPLDGLLFVIYRYIFVLDASRYAQDAARLGSFLAAHAAEAKRQEIGLLLVAAALLASLVLFVCGWRRQILYEYLLIKEARPVPALSAARRAKKDCGQALLTTMGVNLLTLLPAVLVPLLFLCWRWGGAQNMLMNLFLLIGSGLALDPAALWIALILFLGLYIPWIPYRKGRYAAVVNAYER